MNPRKCLLCGVAGVFMIALIAVGGQPDETPAADQGAAATTSERAAVPAVGEETSSTVEDGGTGPYKAIMVSDSSLATHTVFRPRDLTPFGEKEKLPILSWGNGACANSPSGHQNFLSEVASHGFLVIAIGPPPGGRGGRGGGMGGGGGTQSKQLLDAIDWAIAQNENKESRYYQKIATDKVAVAGMSCGGLQALEVSTDPRVTTTMVCNSGILNSPMGGGGARGGTRGGGGGMPGGVPTPAAGAAMPTPATPMVAADYGMPGAGTGGEMPGMGMRGGMPGGGGAMPGGARGGMPGGGGGMAMPAVGKDLLPKLHAPIVYLLGGESDMAFANGSDDFKRIEKLPAVLAYMDVGHGGTYSRPHGGEFARVATAWLKWQLKGDEEAGKMFAGDPCPLSKAEGWTVEKKNIP